MTPSHEKGHRDESEGFQTHNGPIVSYWYIGIFVYLCSNESEGFQTHNGPIVFIMVY